MLDRLKFTARSTLIYSLGSIGIKLIGLILLPIYTDKLTLEQYGMWSYLEILSQVFIILIGLRMSTALLRFYGSNDDRDYRGKVVFTAFWVTLLSVLVFNLLLLPFKRSLSMFFFETGEYSSYFLLLVIWTSFEIFNRLVLDLIRVKEKPVFYITVTIIKFTFILLLNIYFVAFRGMGIEGIILGQLLGSVAMFVITLPFALREMKWSVDVDLFRQMFKYSAPLILSGMSAFLLSAGDRFLVEHFMNFKEVGLYSISYKISNLLKIVFIQAFQLGFLPIAFNMFDKPNSERFFSKILTYYTFLLFWVGLAISMFSREIIILFTSDEAYYDAYRYIPIITLSTCIFGIQNFFIIGIHYAKKTKFLAVIILLALIVSIVSNILLIQRIGLYGVALSFMFASSVMLVMNYIKSQQYYPIKYEIKKILIIAFLSIGLYILTFLFSNSSLVLRIILKIILVALFPFMLYLFKFYEKVELDRIMGAWKKWRNPRTWYKNLKDISLKQSMDSSEI